VKATWKIDALALGMIVAMFALAGVMWSAAPDQIPVHWNWAGEPDRFGGRFEGLFLLPLAAAGVYALLLFLPRLDPRRRNYDAFAGPFAIIRTVVVGLLLGLDVVALLWIRGERAHMNGLLAAEVGIALLLMGNYLPKVKSNWFVGVRTPWTLSSEASWRQTHRLAGWLFTVGGILTVVTALARPDFAPSVMIGAAVAAGGTSVVYSYFAWKNDPARTA
jgi:uncharacterized membrane protein